MVIVKTSLVGLFKASAITVYPFCFVSPALGAAIDNGSVWGRASVAHEEVHYNQQRRWALYGLGVGLLAWYFLYLLCLPVGWNYWRKKWETEAYLAQGWNHSELDSIMRSPPYYLWWM